jgi:hypothetical protein
MRRNNNENNDSPNGDQVTTPENSHLKNLLEKVQQFFSMENVPTGYIEAANTALDNFREGIEKGLIEPLTGGTTVGEKRRNYILHSDHWLTAVENRVMAAEEFGGTVDVEPTPEMPLGKLPDNWIAKVVEKCQEEKDFPFKGMKDEEPAPIPECVFRLNITTSGISPTQRGTGPKLKDILGGDDGKEVIASPQVTLWKAIMNKHEKDVERILGKDPTAWKEHELRGGKKTRIPQLPSPDGKRVLALMRAEGIEDFKDYDDNVKKFLERWGKKQTTISATTKERVARFYQNTEGGGWKPYTVETATNNGNGEAVNQEEVEETPTPEEATA